MRALVVLGICTERDDGKFELTRMGPYLAAKSERSLKALYRRLLGDHGKGRWPDRYEDDRVIAAEPKVHAVLQASRFALAHVYVRYDVIAHANDCNADSAADFRK